MPRSHLRGRVEPEVDNRAAGMVPSRGHEGRAVLLGPSRPNEWRQDMSIRTRLKRLEEKPRSCPECGNTPPRVRAYYPDEGEHPPDAERCPGCGRELLIALRVVYEDVPPRGEGYKL
jgi:uncharacterized protein with PIN domain